MERKIIMKLSNLVLFFFVILNTLCQGMTLEDSRGKKFPITLAQFQALNKKTTLFKEMVDNNVPISFKTDHPLKEATEDNINTLTLLLTNPNKIDSIATAQKRATLFTLANYMDAAPEVTQALALLVYKDTQDELEKLNKKHPFTGPSEKRQTATKLKKVEELNKRARQSLPYFPDFDTFLEEYDIQELNQLVDYYEKSAELDLSPERLTSALNCSKRIGSLKGIERLKECSWATDITHISAPNHMIDSFKIKTLRAIFPALVDVNLKNNCVKVVDQATLTNMPAEFNLNLSNNLISNIVPGSIENPGSLQQVDIEVKNNLITNLLQKTIFKQTANDRIKTWIKALSTQSSVAFKSYIQHTDWSFVTKLTMVTIIAGGATNYLTDCIKFKIELPTLKTNLIRAVRLLQDEQAQLSELETLSRFSGNSDNLVTDALASTLFQDIKNGVMKAISNTLNNYKIDYDINRLTENSYCDEKLNQVIHAILKTNSLPWNMIIQETLRSIPSCIFLNLIAPLLVHRNLIMTDLNNAAIADPYRVRITHDFGTTDFPSNYAYKCFEK